MPVFLHDLRYGTRSLLRRPIFSAVIIVVLALGIGANSAIFSVVNAVLLRPLPYHEPDRLYRLEEVDPKGEARGVSQMDLEAFRQRSHLIEQAGLSRWQNFTLTGPEGQENLYGGKVSITCFPMLGVQPAAGRGFRDHDFHPGAPGVVLISDRLWQRRYARDPRAIGKQLIMNGESYTITGVMSHEFFFEQRFELWIPWQFTAEDTGNRQSRFSAVVRLRPDATLERARPEFESLFRDIGRDDARRGWRTLLTPLHQQLTARVRSGLLILLGAVGFVLLIACVNVANLLLVRASERTREIAIRTALGAGRFRVIRQLLTENLLLALLGGGAGLLAGRWAARGLIAMFPDRIPAQRLDQVHTSGQVLLFTFLLSLLTAVVFGLLPAFQAARTNVNEGLKEGGRGAGPAGHSGRLRNCLVVVETALSLILLIGAGLMLRSFDRLLSVDTGFNPDHLLTMRVPRPATITAKAQQSAYYSRMLDRLQSLPGLNAMGLIEPLPLANFDARMTFAVEGHPPPPGERQLVKIRSVSTGYFRAMGIAVRRGRGFAETDTADAPAIVVVNQTLARQYFPNEDPIGKRVTSSLEMAGPWLTIVGVVNDVKNLELDEKPTPDVYRDYRQFMFGGFAASLVFRTASDPMSLAAAAQRQIHSINPDQPITDLKTMRQVVSDSVSQPRFYTLLLGVFAGLALVLAAAGVYGVLSYSVNLRLREISIRMALGAPTQAIFRDIVGRALVLAGAGVIFGMAGAYALTRLIASHLYQIQATDPFTFTGVPVLLLAVAAAASYLPARRATRVDPAVALRCE